MIMKVKEFIGIITRKIKNKHKVKNLADSDDLPKHISEFTMIIGEEMESNDETNNRTFYYMNNNSDCNGTDKFMNDWSRWRTR